MVLSFPLPSESFTEKSPCFWLSETKLTGETLLLSPHRDPPAGNAGVLLKGFPLLFLLLSSFLLDLL